MKYAKYISEREIEWAPKNKAGVSNYNQDTEKLAADGYLPILETPRPEGGNFTLSYKKEAGQIKFVWSEETPPEPTYAEKRAAEYPSLADQLDMMYWDRVNGTNVWEETVAAVKAKYPKPSEVVIPGELISDNLSDVADVKQTEEQE